MTVAEECFSNVLLILRRNFALPAAMQYFRKLVAFTLTTAGIIKIIKHSPYMPSLIYLNFWLIE
jgi:hypothetical protein